MHECDVLASSRVAVGCSCRKERSLFSPAASNSRGGGVGVSENLRCSKMSHVMETELYEARGLEEIRPVQIASALGGA